MLWFATLALAAPPITEVDFGPLCRDAPPGRPGTPDNALARVQVQVDAAPDARCNDGSPAIYYVRPGVGDDANRWLVVFDGGFGCVDWQSCAIRWCGAGFYARDKMTGEGRPETAPGVGALHPDAADNPLATWTHVSVPYCSSDFWTGRNPEATASHPDFPDLAFSLRFNGADIADAVVTELAHRPDLGLPPLADATQVVLAGSSAGGLGVVLAADRHADLVRAVAPSADVRVVVDSYFPPGGEVLGGGVYTGRFDPEVEAFLRRLASRTAGPRFWRSDTDASCLAAHPEDPWVCLEAQHVAMNHLRTPLFVYMDQEDPVVCRGPCAAGVRAQVAALAHIEEDRPEREGPPEASGAAGWFAPRCGAHTALTSGADGGDRYLAQVLPVGRTPVSYADALHAWLTGVGPSRAIREGPGPACPVVR